MSLEFTQDDLLKKQESKFDILTTDLFIIYFIIGACLFPGFMLLGILSFIKYLAN